MLNKIIILSLSILWLAGCSNAVSYHHSERNSIALEVRTTDPQQPVQGIIGVKTRTIVVAPGIRGSKEKRNGESTSVISDFKFTRDENTDWLGFGKTHIQSAFITGGAAKNASASTAKALSGLGIEGTGDSDLFRNNILSNIYKFLKDKKEDTRAAKYLEQLDSLLALLPKDYPNNTYYSLAGGVLEKRDTTNYKAKDDDFLEVLNYEDDLISDSIIALEEMKENRSIKYKASAVGVAADINGVDFAMLQEELKRLKIEKRKFFNTIGDHNVIDAAAAYMVNLL